MTIKEIIRGLEDQAQDKERLAGGDQESVFTQDADTLVAAVALLKSMPVRTGPGDDTIELIQPPHSNDMALEPCPFCGSESIWYEKYLHDAGPRWRCWCADCIAGSDPGWAQQRIDVREMWNRRAIEPNPPLTLEELREMDGKPYWHVGLQDNSPPPHWAILPDHVAKCPQDYFYGKYWLAYRYELEEGTAAT